MPARDARDEPLCYSASGVGVTKGGAMDTGKAVRLATGLRPDGRPFIGALDVLIPRGPPQGLAGPVATPRLFVGRGGRALLMHEGLGEGCLPAFPGRAG